MIGDSRRRVGDDKAKAQALRLAMLLDEWERSGNRVRTRCARDVRAVLDADDVLGAFVHLIDNGKLTELDELRALIRAVETMDLGGYTQRDADAVAVALWSAGYRRRSSGVHYVIEFDYRSDSGPDRVGPFATKDAAREYVQELAHEAAAAGNVFEAEWSAVPVQPIRGIRPARDS